MDVLKSSYKSGWCVPTVLLHVTAQSGGHHSTGTAGQEVTG